MFCIFCDILKEKSSNIIYETENLFVINDINPKSNIHILFITKEHIKDLNEIDSTNLHVMKDLMESIPKVATILKIENYKIIINCGRAAGQEIMHIHAHLQS